MSVGATTAAAAAAAIQQAIKASGVIVTLTPEAWLEMVSKQSEPLVIQSEYGFFSKHFAYLTSYKGLAFYTRSPIPLPLPRGIELINAKTIWVPG